MKICRDTNIAAARRYQYQQSIQALKGPRKQRGFFMLPGGLGAPRNGAGDPHWANVVALLHCEDGNGATTAVDSSIYANSWVRTGSATVSTSAHKFGSGSINCNTGRFESADAAEFEVSSAYWTCEAFVMPGALSGIRHIFSKRSTTGQFSPFLLRTNGTTLEMFFSTSGSAWNYSDTSAGTLSTGAWKHLAMQRRFDSGSSDTIELYLDGSLTGNVTIPTGTALWNNTLPLAVGGDGPSGYWGSGNYVDEYRFTIGAARYNGPFTPPPAAFSNG